MSYKDPMDTFSNNGSDSEGSELSMNEDCKSSSPVHGIHCFLFSFLYNSEFEKAIGFGSHRNRQKIEITHIFFVFCFFYFLVEICVKNKSNLRNKDIRRLFDDFCKTLNKLSPGRIENFSFIIQTCCLYSNRYERRIGSNPFSKSNVLYFQKQ